MFRAFNGRALQKRTNDFRSRKPLERSQGSKNHPLVKDPAKLPQRLGRHPNDCGSDERRGRLRAGEDTDLF
jgi:hypothetical protein